MLIPNNNPNRRPGDPQMVESTTLPTDQTWYHGEDRPRSGNDSQTAVPASKAGGQYSPEWVNSELERMRPQLENEIKQQFAGRTGTFGAESRMVADRLNKTRQALESQATAGRERERVRQEGIAVGDRRIKEARDFQLGSDFGFRRDSPYYQSANPFEASAPQGTEASTENPMWGTPTLAMLTAPKATTHRVAPPYRPFAGYSNPSRVTSANPMTPVNNTELNPLFAEWEKRSNNSLAEVTAAQGRSRYPYAAPQAPTTMPDGMVSPTSSANSPFLGLEEARKRWMQSINPGQTKTESRAMGVH